MDSERTGDNAKRMKTDFDVLIIGGGAAGLTAAVAIARQEPDIKIAVLEREERVGKKLLRTGNGRCNLTNRDVSIGHYHGGNRDFAAYALDRFPVGTVVRFFGSVGVVTEFADGGRAYPLSHQASSVLDALRFECGRLRVETICSAEAERITPADGGFTVFTPTRKYTARRVIAAVGSGAGIPNPPRDLFGPLGIKTCPQLPAIVPVRTETTWVRQLKGIKFDGRVTALSRGRAVGSADGEILFTETGLSGPPVLELGRLFSHGEADGVSLDLAPAFAPDEVKKMIEERAALKIGGTLENFFTGMLNKRLGQVVVKYCGFGLSDGSGIDGAAVGKLAAAVKDFRIKALGTAPLSQAQAAAGGALTDGFSPFTLESAMHPGFYAVGEALDVDGDCGGYNLHWAWASAMLAAESVCASL